MGKYAVDGPSSKSVLHMQVTKTRELVSGCTARDIFAAVVFMKVAERESFQSVGKELGISRSAISKYIARLEGSLGVTLMNRTPRRISLTDAGSAFYANWLEISDAIAKAAEEVTGRDERPAGLLRVSVPSSLGETVLPRLISDLTDRWPDLRLNVHLGDQFVDVVGGGYDVVIRVAEKLVDSSLYARRIATTSRAVVASPGYLAGNGAPMHPRDLAEHTCIGRGAGGESSVTWSFMEKNDPVDVLVSCLYTADSDVALVAAARRGVGLAYLSEFVVASELRDGLLVKVLDSFCQGTPLGVYAIHPYKKCPAKVQVFVELIESYIGVP
jgi:DNA-binding transcriptional LysR family regulator